MKLYTTIILLLMVFAVAMASKRGTKNFIDPIPEDEKEVNQV